MKIMIHWIILILKYCEIVLIAAAVSILTMFHLNESDAVGSLLVFRYAFCLSWCVSTRRSRLPHIRWRLHRARRFQEWHRCLILRSSSTGSWAGYLHISCLSCSAPQAVRFPDFSVLTRSNVLLAPPLLSCILLICSGVDSPCRSVDMKVGVESMTLIMLTLLESTKDLLLYVLEVNKNFWAGLR